MRTFAVIASVFIATAVCACTSGPTAPRPVASTCPDCGPEGAVVVEEQTEPEIPAATRAWMDRLTVAHEYDPRTGFIVAREVISLPVPLATAPPLRDAVALGTRRGQPVIVFATADRCAPCQQYKHDALNDSRVVERLSRGDLLATHVEVDRETEAAMEILGSVGIPMTYLLRDGAVVAVLRGQRGADDLLRWMEEQGLDRPES